MKKLKAFILVLCIIISIGSFQSNAVSPNPSNNSVNTVDPGRLDFERNKAVDGIGSKLDSKLLNLIGSNTKRSAIDNSSVRNSLKNMNALVTADEAVLKGLKDTTDDLVYVYICLKPEVKTERINSYVNTVKGRDEVNHQVSAWVEKSRLKELASLEEVRSIDLVTPPVVYSGSKITEGDSLLNADDFRSLAGADGTGIKIGIISDGVDNWTTARDSGDLPSDLTVLSNGFGGDEGTAMLEIVHDMAPGAKLYFHDLGGDTITFTEAIGELVNAGCNIICDDIGWLSSPYFEDGPIATYISNLLSTKNVVYISAAGNDAEGHYQSAYRDYPATFIDPDTGGPFTVHLNDFSTSETGYQSWPVDVPANSDLIVVLQWNDKFGASSNDYDAFLWNSSNSLLDLSRSIQDGYGNPIEVLIYHNSSSYVEHTYVEIMKYRGVSKTLELYVYGGKVLDYNNPADSIFGHAAVANVIAVGAVDAATPSMIEPFSSQGPVTLLSGTRKKPDICGIDGVSITGTGGFSSPFYGTSAAAPHIAAAAALLWSQNPDKKAADIRSLLLKGTDDLGTVGYDPIYGNGLSNILKAGGPSKPSVLSAVAGDKNVAISWMPNTDNDLAGYQLEYKPTTAATWKSATIAKTASSYKVMGLINSTEYQFRFKAKDTGNAWSVYSDTITSTPYLPAKITAVMDKTFLEGSEDGKKITVTLANGTFIPELDSGKFSLAGLPSGIAKGAITRISDTSLSIALSGNSAVDYDSNVTASITIDKSQVNTVKPEDLTANFVLKATRETVPAAPAITFSFDGANAGRLMGIKAATMEYSLDKGVSYTTALEDNQQLSSEEIASITAANDIMVRIKEDFRGPAGKPKVLNILDGQAATATANDAKNTVSGMTTKMEFSRDGGPWTKFATLADLGDLRGDTVIKVRKYTTGLYLTGPEKTLTFTAINPALKIAGVTASSFKEGSENGQIITVTLTNGEFTADADTGVTLTGQPEGVIQGTVTRTGNRTLTIALNGNSTVDYDTNINATITIGKEQVIPAQPDDLTGTVVFKATVEKIPAAPAVNFSFDGVNKCKLMGIKADIMEYSLDGGTSYITTGENDLELTDINGITAESDIRVRVKADLRCPLGTAKVINILAGPAAPAVTANDVTNTVSGMTTAMEFSIDGGSTWTRYVNAASLGDLSGDVQVRVRKCATKTTLAGQVKVLVFTSSV